MALTKSLPWTRLLAEGVVVVVSILLALGADAWWSDRLAESARQEWLAALATDLETNASQALSYAERSEGDLGIVQRFVFMSAEEAALIPEDSAWSYLVALWRPNPAPVNTEAIVAALEGAPVLAAEDDELRRAIGEWRIQINVLAEFDRRLWELESLIQDALAGYPEMQHALAEGGGFDFAHSIPSSVAALARQDNQLTKLAARKAFVADLQVALLRQLAEAATKASQISSEARAR